MEQLLHQASTISELAYLRVLQLVHVQTSALVDDLKTYELPYISPRTPHEAAEFRKSMAAGSAVLSSAPGTSAAVSTMLETAMEELFVPYTEGQRYLERESGSLGALYAGLLTNFTRYHVSAFANTLWTSLDFFPHRKGIKKEKPRCLIESSISSAPQQLQPPQGRFLPLLLRLLLL
jgi:hypothetical protein